MILPTARSVTLRLARFHFDRTILQQNFNGAIVAIPIRLVALNDRRPNTIGRVIVRRAFHARFESGGYTTTLSTGDLLYPDHVESILSGSNSLNAIVDGTRTPAKRTNCNRRV
ncbi:hypothetical protein Trydic_g20341 [Trypoxylus dichotomus]